MRYVIAVGLILGLAAIQGLNFGSTSQVEGQSKTNLAFIEDLGDGELG